MTAPTRPRRVPAGAEIALAFAAGAAAFAVVALVLALAGTDGVAIGLAVGWAGVVVAVGRFLGIAYAAPVAIAAVVAYDWFQFPPTHPRAFPDPADLANLAAYLIVAVLVGELGAYGGRRAHLADAARDALADEQTALRRVATLVADGVTPDEIFAAVGREVGMLLGADGARAIRFLPGDEIDQLAGWAAPGYGPLPVGRMRLADATIASEIRRTGRVARVVDYPRWPSTAPELVRRLNVRSGVGAPILVDGRLWGAMLAWHMHPEALPDSAETRIAGFTELMATAISNTAGRKELARLADEQAALRRVATLVARGVPPPDVFAAVAREIGLLLGVDATHIARSDEGTAVGVASWSRSGERIPLGSEAKLEGGNVTALVLRNGRPARMDSRDDACDPIVEMLAERGMHSSVGAPIVVDGRPWGLMIASSKEDIPLPPDTEPRIAAFTELVATAISNADARAESERLNEEQAALRRVATLVARESPPGEIFMVVAAELARLLGVEEMWMIRYEHGTATIVGSWGDLDDAPPVGTRERLGGENVTTLVFRTGRTARIDDYADATGELAPDLRGSGIRSAVGGPLVVDGKIWGAMIAASHQAAPLPAATEARIVEFTELVATSIANVQARADLAASRARLVEATDEERRRVVRDLHDGAQQRLVHTVITLKLALRALDRGEEGGPTLVSEAIEQTDRAMAELHELAQGILPTILTRDGLRAGVESVASRMPVPVGIDVEPARLPAAVESTAYFVVAETLTNVAKHARAASAEVSAHVERGALRIEVRDDGVGGARSDGSGLRGLADRLAVLDGRLAVVTPPDGGTLVTAEIPIPAR
jgi:signal transduction histidine kinase